VIARWCDRPRLLGRPDLGRGGGLDSDLAVGGREGSSGGGGARGTGGSLLQAAARSRFGFRVSRGDGGGEELR
jgi:hypothetical protein